jgi:hexosaminidase
MVSCPRIDSRSIVSISYLLYFVNLEQMASDGKLKWIPSQDPKLEKRLRMDGAIHVIPAPAKIRIQEGLFALSLETQILVEEGCEELWSSATFLADMIAKATNLQLSPTIVATRDVPPQCVTFTRRGCETELGEEGYVLDAGPTGITVIASGATGAFYAVQTLRQLFPSQIECGGALSADITWSIPAVRIHDAPRFGWRGMLLDCCRHFMTKSFVKRYVDLLAYHKMNRFHWHLTDDQGWRIDIDRYPKLTDVGAWRFQKDGSRYGGYYTEQEIRDVVDYAANRHVVVIPEIEMPGHATAALAAYPELSCSGGPFEVATDWGVFDDVYCAGSDTVFTFLQDVLAEVVELFPSEYIHIGGDECPTTRWSECSRCQDRMVREGLEDERELQGYFIKRVAQFLALNDRRLVGWDEILEGELPECAAVQSWRSMVGAIQAARSGHNAIVSPVSHAYFDRDVGVTGLEQVYSFDPMPSELAGEECKHVLGGECCMWTERAPQEVVDAKMFPRLLAMAECLWSPGDCRDFTDFHRRTQFHYGRLRALGVDCGPETGSMAADE